MKKIVILLASLLLLGSCIKPEDPGSEGQQKTEYNKIEQPENQEINQGS
jgi:PBP1b-binding outer membrane lipoprotein LpoB